MNDKQPPASSEEPLPICDVPEITGWDILVGLFMGVVATGMLVIFLVVMNIMYGDRR